MKSSQPIKLSFSVAFQAKYCLVMVGVFICASVVLYLYLDMTLSGSYQEGLRTLYRLDQRLPFCLSVTALLQILFVLLLTVIINMFVSHQIAGPVFRYEDTLSRISEGELPREVFTRDTDQLKPMVDSLNEFSGSLRGLFDDVCALQEKVDSVLDGPDGVGEDLEPLRRQIAEVFENMSAFNPEGGRTQ